ncbi:hypothetical protein C8R45DRAFT_945106 [Mycena sanguinolenta]|nr:hypothetical protein C8R45DRAFT_945106 [Mycena sanguinolenta]
MVLRDVYSDSNPARISSRPVRTVRGEDEAPAPAARSAGASGIDIFGYKRTASALRPEERGWTPQRSRSGGIAHVVQHIPEAHQNAELLLTVGVYAQKSRSSGTTRLVWSLRVRVSASHFLPIREKSKDRDSAKLTFGERSSVELDAGKVLDGPVFALCPRSVSGRTLQRARVDEGRISSCGPKCSSILDFFPPTISHFCCLTSPFSRGGSGSTQS